MRASGWWLLLALLVIGCGDCDDGSGARGGDDPSGDEDGFRWPGSGRAGATAALGDGGRERDAGADSGASSSGDAAVPAPGADGGVDAGPSTITQPDAGGTGGATAGAGAGGVGGTVAGSGGSVADPCGDGDADDDGTPDDCDTCPIGSDDDDNHDGFADLCDQVLWSDSTNTASGGPYTSMRVVLEAWQTPDLITKLASVAINVPIAEGFAVSEDNVAALVAALRGSAQRTLRTELVFNGGATSSLGAESSPVNGSTAVWTRAVVHGSIVGATRDFAVELRGYQP